MVVESVEAYLKADCDWITGKWLQTPHRLLRVPAGILQRASIGLYARGTGSLCRVALVDRESRSSPLTSGGSESCSNGLTG